MKTEVIFKREQHNYETMRKSAGSLWTWAEFSVDGSVTGVTVKLTADISLPKDRLCISFCEPSNGAEPFWLVHEPYISKYFKDKVNIDELNSELDALLENG